MSQEGVDGQVTLNVFKGSVYIVGRTSPHSLYNQELVRYFSLSVCTHSAGWAALSDTSSSQPKAEVKHRMAGLVLKWVTTKEGLCYASKDQCSQLVYQRRWAGTKLGCI